MIKRWFTVALVNLLLATTLGALLRYAFVDEVPRLNFRYVLHAHSHVAMLGWIYLALYCFIIPNFIQLEKGSSRAFNRLFWVTQLSVGGMLLSFPFQGYGPISISFSTLHILCSYYFAWKVWPHLANKDSFASRLLRFALLFMLLSTLGVWSMGPIIAMGMKGSALYYMSVQFYLHFQFNGWFIFAVLALLFKRLEIMGIQIPTGKTRLFFGLLFISCLLTYALAVAWSQPLLIIFIINSIGVLIQLLALWVLFKIIGPIWSAFIAGFDGLERSLVRVAMFSFGLKIMAQAVVAIPFVAEAAYTIRNYVIGFIHLVLLGVISSFLFALAYQRGILNRKASLVRLGIITFVCGIVLSELLLFLQGSMLWGAMGFLPLYYETLFAFSSLMPFGILLTLIGLIWRASY